MLKYFFYYGYNKDEKITYGILKDINSENIRVLLKNNNIIIKNIYPLPFLNKEENKKNLLLFFSQSKIFIKNGYSFLKIFNVLEENTNLCIYIKEMKKQLKKGNNLYKILKNSGFNLKNSQLMIIKAGEEAGNLYSSFDIIEKKIKEEIILKKEIQKIMTYPIIILIMIILLIIFMGLYILPDFIQIIQSTSQKLPFITKIIIFFSKNFLIILPILFIIITFLIKTFKNTKNKKFLLNYLIKISFFENFINKIFVKNFTMILSELISSGITIINGIIIIKDETQYEYFIKKIENIEFSLKKGSTIYHAFKNSNIFSTLDLELLKFSEEVGELEKTLTFISEKNENELKEKLTFFIKILEPLTIIIIGILVTFIFLALYIPIFQIMDEI